MAWTNRIRHSLLSGRIDAEYYSPAVYTHLSRLATLRPVPMRNFVVDIRSEPSIHTSHYAEDGNEGLHIVSPSNFTDFVIDFTNTKKLAARHQNLFSEFVLRPGRILYALVGDVGHACVVPADVPAAISYRRTANIRVSGIDEYFVAVFLNTTTGVVQLKRLTTGVIQDQLRLEDSADILLPGITSVGQRYIGDKVRQAERLRARASKVVQNVRQQHIALIPAFHPTRAKWTTFQVAARNIDDVVVPHYYPPAVSEYLAAKPAESLRDLCEVIYSGETYEPDDQGVDQATSRSCTGRFVARPFNRVRPPARTDFDLQAHDLLLTNAAHDKGYIGRDVTYYHGGPRNIPSAKVMVLRPRRSVVPSSYLHTYLQTAVGFLQIQSAIRGVSAGIRADDMGKIQIPVPPLKESDIEIGLSLDLAMRDAGAAEEAAALLCISATQLVERLIEGKVAEADLVAAQRALEAGNSTADRELLQSLRQPDSATSKPLIPDVDALYAILDEPEDAT